MKIFFVRRRGGDFRNEGPRNTDGYGSISGGRNEDRYSITNNGRSDLADSNRGDNNWSGNRDRGYVIY